jgi:hypothetical protein
VLGAFGALSAGATLVPVSTRFTGPGYAVFLGEAVHLAP